MCAQFLIKSRVDELRRKYGITVPEGYPEIIDLRAVPYRPAPVIVARGSERVLTEMNFSLVPAWSKEPKVKFATHNARLESIDEKPTWKKPFLRRHALVPISAFVEPIYTDRLAGNMVQFFAKPGELLTAAAVWDEWVDKTTGEVLQSFAIITDDPPKFVAEIGHDRCPVFLEDSAFAAWLDVKESDPTQLKLFLRSHVPSIDYDVRIDRPLKKGWEKRA